MRVQGVCLFVCLCLCVCLCVSEIVRVKCVLTTSTCADKLTLGTAAKLLFTFKNPLPVKMEDVTLSIDVDEVADGKTRTPHS